MRMYNGTIKAISISTKKGIPKTNTDSAKLLQDFGIVGDVHAGDWHRQISLLAMESIEKMKDKLPELSPGDFAENITTSGFDLLSLTIGDKVLIGKDVKLEITQIGKECHSRCNIFNIVGDCVMPKEGLFAKVLSGGMIFVNDSIEKTNPE